MQARKSGKTLTQVASELGVTRERASQLFKRYRFRLVWKIRKYAHSLGMSWPELLEAFCAATGYSVMTSVAVAKAPVQDLEKLADYLERLAHGDQGEPQQCAQDHSETA